MVSGIEILPCNTGKKEGRKEGRKEGKYVCVSRLKHECENIYSENYRDFSKYRKKIVIIIIIIIIIIFFLNLWVKKNHIQRNSMKKMKIPII